MIYELALQYMMTDYELYNIIIDLTSRFQRSSFPKSSTHDDKTRGCNGMDWGKTKKGRGVHFSATESFGKNYIVPAS